MQYYCISISIKLIFVNLIQSLIISANFHETHQNIDIINSDKFEARQTLVSENGLPGTNLASGAFYDNQFATAILRFVTQLL
jgi:hypothetical protein